jgi:hypothetical protein
VNEQDIEERVSKVLKDRDFLRLEVSLDLKEKEKIINQLEQDTFFLK